MDRVIFSVIILFCLLFVSCSEYSDVLLAGGKVLAVETYGDRSKLLIETEVVWDSVSVNSGNRIVVDDSITYQGIEGFGAALTGSSAYLIFNHPDKKEILNELFSEDSGAGLNYIRISLGSSDFSTSWYTYADEEDETLDSLSIEKEEEYLIPLLMDILEINPDVKIMATPWTAPGWMKIDNYGELGMVGGKLNPDYFGLYAKYLFKTLVAFRDRGIVIDTVSLQNEPLHSSANYPCMHMSPSEQAELIKEFVMLLKDSNISTKILLYDHNWDVYNYPNDVVSCLSSEELEFVIGSAWHGYGGSPDNMSLAKEMDPGLGVYFTEITGGGWSTSFSSNLRWNYENIFIGGLRNWAETVLLWNLALDKDGKPNIRGESTSSNDVMRGVLTLDEDSYRKEVEYYALVQVSKYIKPGSVRLYSSEVEKSGALLLRSVVFKNPDGTMVLVVSNNSWLYDSVSFEVDYNGNYLNFELPKESVVLFTW